MGIKMKHIKLYEYFDKEEFLKKKAEKELNVIQELGNEYMVDIVKESDFDSMEYLLSIGYDLNMCDASENLVNVALEYEQMKMLNYLLKSDLCLNSGFNKPIDVFSIHNFMSERKKIDKKAFKILKYLVDKGYDFIYDSINYITLHLCSKEWDDNNWIYIPLPGVLPFLDYLLKKDPAVYPHIKNILNDKLLKKYAYLERSSKTNLWNNEIR